MNEDPIDKALGLRPIEEALNDQETELVDQEAALPLIAEVSINSVATVDTESDETVCDIELARSNIKNIIEQGDESLKEMINLAKQSESPRAFEVASGLMKTLLDANRDFVEMSMKKKYAKEEITKPKEAQAATNITNNNLILSTTELLKMLKGDN
jgi:hypothetical protein